MSVPPRRPRPPLAIALGLGLALALNGCDQPTGSTRPKSTAPATPVVEQQPAPPPEPARVPILGKTTQDIREVEKEKQAGGVVTQPRITSKDPITLPGNAYVSIIGRSAMLNIEHTLDLYKAETGEYPKSHEEFMENIIKRYNIALPKLPSYQEYSYDVPSHKLLIMEYPDRR